MNKVAIFEKELKYIKNESFKNDTYPIISHFDNKGLVYRIDGNQSLDYTLEQVFEVLGKKRGHNR